MTTLSSNSSVMPVHLHTANKILILGKLAERLTHHRTDRQTVVLCHGTFDLLHIGHIKHLEAARTFGDILVVTVTPDRFVDKGPHRPAFPEGLRAEALAALACIDYVAINEWPTAVETIRLLRPDIYVKGAVRHQGPRDHTDAILLEEEAVRAAGGRMELTEEETYSASSLINRFVDVFSPEVKAFLDGFGAKYTAAEIVGQLRAIRDLKILVVGETIIDEYQFCDVMTKSNKDPILAARYLSTERYAGGILAIANHLANFCDHVGLLSMLGDTDSQEDLIAEKLNRSISARFLRRAGSPTIVKRRFLHEYMAVKLFEIYVMRDDPMDEEEERSVCQALEELLPQYDAVVVADYGHGLLGERAISILCDKARFLAVNCQTNAGNRGFNLISKYPKADYISIDEPEARLETRNPRTDLRELIQTIAQRVSCKRVLVTWGKKGCLAYDANLGIVHIPAFAIRTVDRLGAGDAVLALTAPCAALGAPMDQVAFIGNVVGAEACAIMGNKSAIDSTGLFRHISSLLPG